MALLLVWALGGIYSGNLLKRGWVPHDEGTLAQSAERVLHGELPHRDFDELYTGGLTYLNAFAFWTFGESLSSPRMVLFLFFLAWVPTFYSIAAHFATPLAAAAVTLLAVAWSLPNYSAAIPSWYNLFFATFGMAAVFRYLKKPAARWLFLGGLCGGISFLFKVSGLFYVAAFLLFIVYREQAIAQHDTTTRAAKSFTYLIFVRVSLLAFVAALSALVRTDLSFVSLVEFMLPGAVLAMLCWWRENTIGHVSPGNRFRSLFQMLWPFVVGFGVPVLIFLIPYLRSGDLADFIRGVFVLPARRLGFAARLPAGFGLNKILATVVLSALLVTAYRSRLRRPWLLYALVVVGLGELLWFSRTNPRVFVLAWAPLPLLIPLTVCAGVWLLARRRDSAGIPPLRQQQIILLLAMAAVCSLIQLPFAVGIYLCYVVPLLVLALVGIFATQERPVRPLLGLLLIFYLAFAILRVTPGFLYIMGSFYQPNPQYQRLSLPRAGGLRVNPSEAREYEELIPLIERHADASQYIYAAPDCPEVYFLSGKRNPTRTLFDFFEDPSGHEQRVLSAIDSHQVSVVAILSQPAFSPPMSADLLQALRTRFPEAAHVGRYEVRWRQVGDASQAGRHSVQRVHSRMI